MAMKFQLADNTYIKTGEGFLIPGSEFTVTKDEYSFGNYLVEHFAGIHAWTKLYLKNGNYIEIYDLITPNSTADYWGFNVAFYYANNSQAKIFYVENTGNLTSSISMYYSNGYNTGTGNRWIRSEFMEWDNSDKIGYLHTYQFSSAFALNTAYSTSVAFYSVGTQLANDFFNAEKVIVWPGEDSTEGGGTGTFDGTSDDINVPSVPTLSAVQAGFITLYQPTLTQLNDLAAYMWSSSFDLDTFKKLFADPMDVIVGLSILPVAVSIAGTKNVKIGFIDTGISMNYVSNQFIQIDCGSLNIQEFYGSALDYSPYTKLSIYLPYIGTRPLDTDDIMSKTVHVVYNIDILTGSCTAMVKSGNSVLYEFSGACATAIPISGQNWNQLITSCIQLAGAGLAVAASGGSAAGLLPSTANAVMAMKPNIQHTGAVSGSAGMLGVQIPYIIAQIPRQSLADNYNKYVGYPCNITYLLSTLTGFTQCESVKLTGLSHATEAEKTEIKNLLESGVIIQ